jgi:hypothetical protein
VAAIAAGGYQNLALIQTGLSAPAVQLSNVVYTGGAFSLQTPTTCGRTYYLQHKDSLASPWWMPSLPVPGNGAVQTLADPGAPATQRFYRVWQKP